MMHPIAFTLLAFLVGLLILGALVRDSAGNFHVDITANLAGRWQYRFYSTGTGQAANEEEFIVGASNF